MQLILASCAPLQSMRPLLRRHWINYAVKQTKELDDNGQSKNDRKDPKVIAKLVTEGRYSAPYTPDGVYADLRIMVTNRKRLRSNSGKGRGRGSRYLKEGGSYETVW